MADKLHIRLNPDEGRNKTWCGRECWSPLSGEGDIVDSTPSGARICRDCLKKWEQVTGFTVIREHAKNIFD